MNLIFSRNTIKVCCVAIAGLLFAKGNADIPKNYSIYSTTETILYDRATTSSGDIGSNQKVTIGFKAYIKGSVTSAGNISINNETRIDGNVTAKGTISKGTNGVVISGTQTSGVSTVPVYTIPTVSFTPGTNNITVNNDATRDLTPGSYGDVVIKDRATLKLVAGTYNFRSLSLWNDTKLILNFAANAGININTSTNLTFLDRVNFLYMNSPDFSKVKLYCGSANTVKLGNDMHFAGYLSSPNGTIEINDRVRFEGAVYGKKVVVKYDTKSELQLPTGEGIIAVLRKVIPNGSGTYTVQFGYVNHGTTAVVLPVGSNNYMTGLPGNNMDGGQVTVFYPGQVDNAFSVITDFSGSGSIGWVLYGGDPDHSTFIDVGPINVVNNSIPIEPTLKHVISNCDGTYSAVFGYRSNNDVVVRKNIGSDNLFSGLLNPNGGQPILFERGIHDEVFSVKFTSASITWNLTGNSVTAYASSALVSCNNIMPILTAVVENGDGSSKAVFGYSNTNQIAVSRPVSSTNNYFSGVNDSNAGQPVKFEIGTVNEAFSVNFTGSQISWTLDGTTVTALKSSSVNREFGMWNSIAIGTGVSGNYSIKGNSIKGFVTGVPGTATNDKMYFVNYSCGADFTVIAKIKRDTANFPYKAGITIRNNSNDNAAYFALTVKQNGSLVRESRLTDGTAFTENTVGSITSSSWLKITKTGTMYEAFISSNGTTWTSTGTANITTGSPVFLGLALVGNGYVQKETAFENVSVTFADNNSNNIPDVAEAVIGGGTAGLPQRSDWINEGISTEVTDNYSSVSGYGHCTAVKSVISHSEADGLVLPVDRLVEASSAPVPPTPGLIIDGGKLHSITGTVKQYDKVMQAFPVSTQLRGVPMELLQLDHYNTLTLQWEKVPLTAVTANAVYAPVKSYSYYRLATKYVIKKVATSAELVTALAEAKTSATVDIPYAIVCQGSEAGTYYKGGEGDVAFSIPANTNLIGGVPNVSSLAPDVPFVSDPKKYKSILTVRDGADVKQVVLDMQVNIGGGAQVDMHTTISGFTIKGGNNLGSEWSAGGLRIVGMGGHVAYVDVNNCIFDGNTGTNAGAVIVANARFIKFTGCVFTGNKQIPAPDNPEAPKSGKKYGASAILFTLGGDCHTEGCVNNCVFINNEAQGDLYAGTVTVFGDYAMTGDPASVPVETSSITRGVFNNCTFTNNKAGVATSTTCAGAIVRKNTLYDTVRVKNSIIWNNAPTSSSTISVCNLTSADVKYTNINNSSIQTATTGTPDAVSGNLNEDPFFVNGTTVEGLRLQYTSVCRNKGADIDTVTNDINGLPRRVSFYDMGAYENALKILPIGDENTIGYDGNCYRAFLKKLMQNNGWEVDFIGSQNSSPFAGILDFLWADASALCQTYLVNENDIEHDGVVGKTIQSFLGTDLNDQNVINTVVSTYLSTRKDFDILLLFVGTADILGTSTPNDIFGYLNKLVIGINNWISLNGSDKKIVVSKIPSQNVPVNGTVDTRIQGVNSLINSSLKFGNKVDEIAEMYNPSFDLGSGTIVNLSGTYYGDSGNETTFFKTDGYNIIAHEWWRQIQTILP